MAKKEIEFDTERIVEKVYSIKELHKILEDVVVDYINETRLMSDERLNYDREKWMRDFGRGNNVEGETPQDIYDADIQSLAIWVEQLRRFGKINYGRSGSIKE